MSDHELTETPPPPLLQGVQAIEAALTTLPLAPGVYRMLDGKGDVLYVGKARALRKRVYSYTQTARLPERLKRMVHETRRLEVVTTASEAEALLLEANLIKRLRPRYNIVLRDDKSFPWLVISDDHPWPQISKHRGERRKGASYYGPFASVWAVNQTLTALQRVFLLRSCNDTVFENRERPCLLHQIKRCSAPCVERIGRDDYRSLVAEAKQFLAGHVPSIQKRLAAEMEQAAEALEFERAAALRDRIRGLTHVQGSSRINVEGLGDADVVALHMAAGQSCVQVFFFRGGRNNGNRPYFLSHSRSDITPEEVMGSFLAQLYADLPPPPLILTAVEAPEAALLAEALSDKAGRKVEFHTPRRGDKLRLVEHAATNAREALERRLAESTAQAQLLDGAQRLFDLPERPERIEVYDNSHIQGTAAYGAMIVAGPAGFMKNAYRKFSIKEAKPGDDFAMMREVLDRRFSRALKEDPTRAEPGWPDLVLIDGGVGQLNVALEVMRDLGLEDIPLVAIAKGVDRDAGREWFHMAGREAFQLPPRDPVLYYLQRLRDEAHRFVIGAHRAGRAKAMTRSELDDIPGVGAAVKRRLLNHFGSARGVRNAGEDDLANCPGIGRSLARRIHGHFHPGATVPQGGGS
ncbi:excinuclease ABC subunit UvrC [Sabulicella glaciei]|uniref:UvrABC system protein C n=1 Tax=Sabulicella glaciei TaxID=2984948 RepID=A0ABT3NUG8_9PROT|nr:excinuclease ABC subunit UvrC [Roseococcus sp. MDT2-1-1]MCW8085805.1 excinuclease ABC subunit UvrC [Roseococcus sp. MDT2-1-1]